MSLVGNGTNAYGTTAATAFVDSEAFTIEFWTKALADAGSGNGQGILAKWQTTNWRDAAWGLWQYPTKRLWAQQSGSSNFGAAASEVGDFINDEWIHYVWYHGDSDENKIYINGELVWNTAVLPINDKNWQLDILRSGLAGADGDGSSNVRYYNGKLSELRIWTGERTQEEILANMFTRINPDESNLLYYWPLDEPSGTTATDLVNGLNFSLAGDYAWDSDIPPFNFGGGIF